MVTRVTGGCGGGIYVRSYGGRVVGVEVVVVVVDLVVVEVLVVVDGVVVDVDELGGR